MRNKRIWIAYCIVFEAKSNGVKDPVFYVFHGILIYVLAALLGTGNDRPSHISIVNNLLMPQSFYLKKLPFSTFVV